MAKSSFSMVFLAPAVFLLAVCVFIGLLLMVEKALTSAETPATNPALGELVSPLGSTAEPEAQREADDQTDRTAG